MTSGNINNRPSVFLASNIGHLSRRDNLTDIWTSGAVHVPQWPTGNAPDATKSPKTSQTN